MLFSESFGKREKRNKRTKRTNTIKKHVLQYPISKKVLWISYRPLGRHAGLKKWAKEHISTVLAEVPTTFPKSCIFIGFPFAFKPKWNGFMAPGALGPTCHKNKMDAWILNCSRAASVQIRALRPHTRQQKLNMLYWQLEQVSSLCASCLSDKHACFTTTLV